MFNYFVANYVVSYTITIATVHLKVSLKSVANLLNINFGYLKRIKHHSLQLNLCKCVMQPQLVTCSI